MMTNQFDAAEYGTYDEFCALYGGDPNATPSYPSLNLLERAVLGRQGDEGERMRIVSRLISDGGDPNYSYGKARRNALHHLYQQGAGFWSAEGLRDVTRALAAAGCDVNAVDGWGRTPMSYAATNLGFEREGVELTWRALMEAGADPALEGRPGQSALEYATTWKNARLLSVLGEYGYGPGAAPADEAAANNESRIT